MKMGYQIALSWSTRREASRQNLIGYRDFNHLALAGLACQGWGRVWAHASAFSLAACSICGSIFSIA
jgi:hypothetical protein